jgi:hypothetical protein
LSANPDGVALLKARIKALANPESVEGPGADDESTPGELWRSS